MRMDEMNVTFRNLLLGAIRENRPEFEKILEKAGWHTWYNDNYWVNRKCVKDPMSQDYTNYGMSFEEAVLHEAFGNKPFGPNPLAGLFGIGAMFK